MNDAVFQSAIKTLGVDEPPRVWSFIVTVFGDLAQRHGDVIAGPILADILSPVGVRPEAMRVALHRLRNEGWIETAKRGRVGLHSLSEHGLHQSAHASQRIYAAENSAKPEWHIVCFGSSSNGSQDRARTLAHAGYLPIAAGVYVSNGAPQLALPDALVLEGTIGVIPKWLSDAAISQTQRNGFTDLLSALSALRLGEPEVHGFSPIQIATLRALIVHRWRKLVLKLPAVPDDVFGEGFEGIACRAKVMETLALLPKPSVAALGSIPL